MQKGIMNGRWCVFIAPEKRPSDFLTRYALAMRDLPGRFSPFELSPVLSSSCLFCGPYGANARPGERENLDEKPSHHRFRRTNKRRR